MEEVIILFDSRKEEVNTYFEYVKEITTDALKTANGEKLKTIKNQRNDLAHGFVSFKNCGKDRTFSEMETIKNQSLQYIEQILANMDIFLKNKDYLK